MKDTEYISTKRRIFDLEQTVEISKSFSSVLEFASLIESILYICMGQMKVLGAGVFIAKDLDSKTLVLDDTYNGLDTDTSVSYKIAYTHPLIKLLENEAKPLTIPEIIDKIGSTVDITALTSLNPSLVVPLIAQNKLNGILVLGEKIDLGNGTQYSNYEKDHINTISSLAAISIRNAVLLEMSTTDMMTKLKLKHYFFSILNAKIERAAETNVPISVAMFDIDFFKRFNDTYGHACGDTVLIKVAQIIKEGIRSKDIACRYGGEEFVTLFYNCDAKEALTVADRIRHTLENTDIGYKGTCLHVTISGGVSTLEASQFPITAEELIDIADHALYYSKENGRNKVTHFNQTKNNTLAQSLKKH
jgi:diguanylate cyclase (GGDEF)-like protein